MFLNKAHRPHQFIRRSFLRRVLGLLLVPVIIAAAVLPATARGFSEVQIRAVYLFNLTSFVQWPPKAFTDPAAPLRIAVYGDDEASDFIEIFRKVIRGERHGQRPIVIERFSATADPTGYHLLFIASADRKETDKLLAAVAGQAILTVGASPGFCQRGGVINLLRRGNRIGLEANVAAAKAAGLQVSSKLLRIATIVNASGGKGGGS